MVTVMATIGVGMNFAQTVPGEGPHKKLAYMRLRDDGEWVPDERFEIMMDGAQIGKTTDIHAIIRKKYPEDIHILVTSNNRDLTDQTSTRGKNDLYKNDEDDYVEIRKADGTIYAVEKLVGESKAWMSGSGSKKKTNLSVSELFDAILLDNVRMITCCSNAARFKYIKELLTKLEKAHTQGFLGIRSVCVWYDEGDSYVNLWSQPKHDFLHLFTCVKRVVVVSATEDEVISKKNYPTMNIIQNPNPVPLTYLRLEDCQWDIIEDPDKVGVVPYIELAMEKHPEWNAPGVRLYVPGEFTRKTHDDVESYFLPKNFSVYLSNGKRKEITTADSTKIPVKTNEGVELKHVLAGIYDKHNLSVHPFVVTGNLCVSRGISTQGGDVQSGTFLYSGAIIAPSAYQNSVSLYQGVCRMLGHFKQMGHRPIIVCTSEDRKNLLRMEKRAQVGRLAHMFGWTHISQHHLKLAEAVSLEPGKVYKADTSISGYTAYYAEFTRASEVIVFCNKLRQECGATKYIAAAHRDADDEQGFVHETLDDKQKKCVKSVNDVRAHPRPIWETKADLSNPWRPYLVGYANTRDPSTVRYFALVRGEDKDVALSIGVKLQPLIVK